MLAAALVIGGVLAIIGFWMVIALLTGGDMTVVAVVAAWLAFGFAVWAIEDRPILLVPAVAMVGVAFMVWRVRLRRG